MAVKAISQAQRHEECTLEGCNRTSCRGRSLPLERPAKVQYRTYPRCGVNGYAGKHKLPQDLCKEDLRLRVRPLTKSTTERAKTAKIFDDGPLADQHCRIARCSLCKAMDLHENLTVGPVKVGSRSPPRLS